MSRFNLADRLKEEAEQEAEQIKLRKKHNITQDDILIVEKSNVYKFTVKLLISIIKTIAAILLIVLAAIGLTTIIYPNIREEFFVVFYEIWNQFLTLIGVH